MPTENENDIDLTAPISNEERETFRNNLTPDEKLEVRRRQLLDDLVKTEKPVDWGSLTEGEFRQQLHRLKIGG